MRIEIEPIGYVQASRPHAEDDFWGGEQARIELVPQFAPDALAGLAEFSHVEVLFYFHQVDAAKIVAGARHPRNNQQWPRWASSLSAARTARIVSARRFARWFASKAACWPCRSWMRSDAAPCGSLRGRTSSCANTG